MVLGALEVVQGGVDYILMQVWILATHNEPYPLQDTVHEEM
jgi:hypothetical protein